MPENNHGSPPDEVDAPVEETGRAEPQESAAAPMPTPGDTDEAGDGFGETDAADGSDLEVNPPDSGPVAFDTDTDTDTDMEEMNETAMDEKDPAQGGGAKAAGRKLGRGLSALLGDDEQDYADLDKLRASKTVPVEFLLPGRFQPRRHFDESEISGLADSIRARGILQPILVRRHPEQVNHYEIIAGERRWRAAQAAKLHEVPVLVRELDDGAALEIALVENLQRQNLNPVEEAAGYRRLMDEFGHTQEVLAKTIGRSRSHIANTLRLLNLPEEVKALIEGGVLTAGHARAVAAAPEPEKLAKKVAAKGLSVRQTERLAQKARDAETAGLAAASAQPRSKPLKDTDTLALEREVGEALGLRVSIDHGQDGGGAVAVAYDTLEQLEVLLARLSRPAGDGLAGPERSDDPFKASDDDSKDDPGGGSSGEATFAVEDGE